MSYQIVSVLDSVLGASKQFSKGEYYYYCPFCGHYNAKLAVNINKRKWHCWKCNARGGTLLSLLKRLNVSKEQISTLATILSDELPRYKESDDSVSVLSLPSEFVPLHAPLQTLAAHHAKRYLIHRGYTDDDILRYNIGFCESGVYQNRVIIPSYDESGMLNFFVGRDFYETSSLKYLIPPVSKNIIGFENLINWGHPIVITEGVFDAMAIKRNSIPVFGKTLPKRLRERIIKEGVSEIYLALDSDALKDTLKIAEQYMKEGITVYVIEMTGKDASEMGFTQIQGLIKAATPLTFMELMQLKMRLIKV